MFPRSWPAVEAGCPGFGTSDQVRTGALPSFIWPCAQPRRLRVLKSRQPSTERGRSGPCELRKVSRQVWFNSRLINGEEAYWTRKGTALCRAIIKARQSMARCQCRALYPPAILTLATFGVRQRKLGNHACEACCNCVTTSCLERRGVGDCGLNGNEGCRRSSAIVVKTLSLPLRPTWVACAVPTQCRDSGRSNDVLQSTWLPI